MSYTRRSDHRAENNNNTLLNRRFMFGERQVPDQTSFSGPQDSNFIGMRVRPTDSGAIRSTQERALNNGDYNIFLRSFDSNQRLTQQSSNHIQEQIGQYRGTYSENPIENRNQPIIPNTMTNNPSFNPYAGGFDRQGLQTRYSSKKSESLQKQFAAKQQENSFTPQSINSNVSSNVNTTNANTNWQQSTQLWPFMTRNQAQMDTYMQKNEPTQPSAQLGQQAQQAQLAQLMQAYETQSTISQTRKPRVKGKSRRKNRNR